MKLSNFTQYVTPVNAAFLLGGTAIILLGLTCAQDSCGKRHETAALVAGTQADVHAGALADLKQQLAGKEAEIASVKETALSYKKKYEVAKAKIPLTPLPAPVGETALAKTLVEIGLGDGTQVQIGVPSTLNTTDATFVFGLDQQAKRAVQLEAALSACDGALKASEAVQKAQEEGLKLSGDALRQSQAEAQARAIQAQELGKALKVEKQNRWQKYMWGAAGVAATLLIKK